MSFRQFRNGALAAAALMSVGSLASTSFAQGGPQGPPPVTVAKPVLRSIVEMDEYTGRFDAAAFVEVRARVSGYLDTVHFQDGATVNAGDLLFTIDRRTYQAAYSQAQATLNTRQTEFDLAKVEYERYQRLTQSGAAAAATLDQRRQAFLSAQSGINGARAAAESARLALSFTEVRAPITGRISRKLVSEGNLVRENESLLTTIVQIDPVHFYFDIDERSYLSYQRIARQGGNSSSGGSNGRGLQVSVMLTDEKVFTHKGVLDFTDNRVDTATGTMRLRAVFDNKDQFLTPGLFGRIAVPGSPQYQAVMVPDEAILTDLDRRYVYVVGDGGAVQQRPIRTGSRTDNYRIVREGLKGDETVVINGLQRVRLGGGKVTPMPVELPQVWGGLMSLPQPAAPGGGQQAPK
jgi:multidrug efflux system membrane fusion protein